VSLVALGEDGDGGDVGSRRSCGEEGEEGEKEMVPGERGVPRTRAETFGTSSTPQEPVAASATGARALS